tara:strand:+ start:304 stop:537 length:234 start_codon:yes stop_codon:yes gene_type:complete
MEKISTQTMEELGLPSNAQIIGTDENSDVTIFQASQGDSISLWVVQQSGSSYDVDEFEYVTSTEYGYSLGPMLHKYA